jgi:glutaredoxin
MKVTIYSKEGCEYCGHAVKLCESEGLEFEKKMVTGVELKSLCGKATATYPQISIDGSLVGTYFNFRDFMEDEYEPILAETLNRFTVFPLQYPDLWQLYKKAQMSNWTAEEIDMSKDMDDWKELTSNEQKFIKYILAFFAGSDGIVFENINNNFADEVQISEARSFYAYQSHNEMVHGETYSKLIHQRQQREETLVPSDSDRPLYKTEGGLGAEVVRKIPTFRRTPFRVRVCRGYILFGVVLCHLLAQKEGSDARFMLFERTHLSRRGSSPGVRGRAVQAPASQT